MNLKREAIITKRLENELHNIRQRIDKEKDLAKKAEMLKVYHKMSKILI